jgi:hypothetical protein
MLGNEPESRVGTEATLGSAWRETGSTSVLCLSDDRLILTEPGGLKVLGLEHKDPESWRVRNSGRLEIWKVSVSSDVLRTEVASRPREFRRVPVQPKECDLQPFPLGKAIELSPERRRSIEEEIVARLRRDQAPLKGEQGGGPSRDAVVAENTEFLRGLLREVGWIDATRFSIPASGNAVVLIKHSGDLPLMMAILPFVERDFKTSAAGNQVYAVLYDGIQIMLGRKQRYGSQLGEDSEGNPMVLPLEDPARVDEFRKLIGLSSLAEYFEMAKELYPGKTIRMPRADE